MTEAERIKQRTLALMQNKGYSWSKAMAIAAETIKSGGSSHATPTKR